MLNQRLFLSATNINSRRQVVRFCLLGSLVVLAGTAFGANASVEDRLASQGLLLTAIYVFAAGLVVSVTPCVYPMIPITLSVIGAKSAGQKPFIGFLRSAIFVLGIAVVYTALGLIVANSHRSVGFLFQNKLFLALIAAFFVAMGISMLGFFDIQLPPAIASKLQSGSNRGGFVGAFLLGLSTGVVASPCGSPVLLSVLFVAAQAGGTFTGGLLLFSYALGIGMLFLILGTFPSFLGKMPRSGVWMEDVKKLMGLILIGVAFYYVRPGLLTPAIIFWPMAVVVCLAAAIAIAAKASERQRFPKLQMAWKICAAGFAITAIGLAAAKVPDAIASRGKSETSLLIVRQAQEEARNSDNGATTSSQAGKTAIAKGPDDLPAADVWMANEASALALAKKEGKPVIVDFGAAWCAACKELEHKTFPVPEVRRALANFVKVRIDCTDADETNEALQKKYNSKSLPTVAFIGKNGDLQSKLTLYEFESPAQFLERVKKVPQ